MPYSLFCGPSGNISRIVFGISPEGSSGMFCQEIAPEPIISTKEAATGIKITGEVLREEALKLYGRAEK